MILNEIVQCALICEQKPYDSFAGQVLSSCLSRLAPSRSGDAVKVSVYFESKCPDSIRFITTMLYPTWEKLQHTGIIHVELFPFGKAFVSSHFLY